MIELYFKLKIFSWIFWMLATVAFVVVAFIDNKRR